MIWPLSRIIRSQEDTEKADQAVTAARSHLRILVNELDRIASRIEAKAERLSHDR